MTKLSEAAATSKKSEVAKRVQSEAGTVSDVVAPPWLKRRTLGGQKKKA